MHNIVNVSITKLIPQRVPSIMKKITNFITQKDKLYFYEVEFEMENSVGYEPRCLLLLDTYEKVVVSEVKGRIVKVGTIKPTTMFKVPKGVVHLLTRAWAG